MSSSKEKLGELSRREGARRSAPAATGRCRGAVRSCTRAAGLLLCLTSGCGFQEICSEHGAEGVTVVLTFDDGPIAADVPDAARLPHRELLLEPLRGILEVLWRRNLQALFFIEGPGTPEAAQVLRAEYAEGILSIHEAGHVLGYHGFSHDARIWASPLTPPLLAKREMTADLDRLERFLDDLLGARALRRGEVFAPIFRQPFGGAGVGIVEGWEVAAGRGWTYHGYLIDSLDWAVNADAAPALVAALPAATETDHVALVLSHLRAGAERHADRAVVDVLFHVNAFTAAHLEEWIDELIAAFQARSGSPVRFGVPECYLMQADPVVDLTFVGQLVDGPS